MSITVLWLVLLWLLLLLLLLVMSSIGWYSREGRTETAVAPTVGDATRPGVVTLWRLALWRRRVGLGDG